MSCDYSQLPHPGIQSLHPYIPGKSIESLAREQGLKNIIKLASNENPLGCSSLVKKALAEFPGIQIAGYPSPSNHPLYQKLSNKLGISEQMLTLGNGSDLLFFFMLVSFALHTGKQVLTHEKAFISFPIQAQTLGIPTHVSPLKSNWEVDIDALIKACTKDTAIIFVANPNNPTGLLVPTDEIKRLLNHIPSTTILLLDEAYYEYAYAKDDKTTLNLLNDYSNLVITRTFSKVYGLAGLRLGYAIANSQITEILQRAQLPFVVNQASLVAAFSALDDEAFVAESIELNKKGMLQMIAGLNHLNIDYIASHCNFLTIDCKTNALEIYKKLLSYGIIVRPLTAYGLTNHLRISIGNKEQITQFLDKLAICLADTK